MVKRSLVVKRRDLNARVVLAIRHHRCEEGPAGGEQPNRDSAVNGGVEHPHRVGNNSWKCSGRQRERISIIEQEHCRSPSPCALNSGRNLREIELTCAQAFAQSCLCHEKLLAVVTCQLCAIGNALEVDAD